MCTIDVTCFKLSSERCRTALWLGVTNIDNPHIRSRFSCSFHEKWDQSASEHKGTKVAVTQSDQYHFKLSATHLTIAITDIPAVFNVMSCCDLNRNHEDVPSGPTSYGADILKNISMSGKIHL